MSRKRLKWKYYAGMTFLICMFIFLNWHVYNHFYQSFFTPENPYVLYYSAGLGLYLLGFKFQYPDSDLYQEGTSFFAMLLCTLLWPVLLFCMLCDALVTVVITPCRKFLER